MRVPFSISLPVHGFANELTIRDLSLIYLQ